MTSLLTARRRINPIYAAFLIVAFLTGIAGALQAPTLSLFLTTEVKVRPLWVAVLYRQCDRGDRGELPAGETIRSSGRSP